MVKIYLNRLANTITVGDGVDYQLRLVTIADSVNLEDLPFYGDNILGVWLEGQRCYDGIGLNSDPLAFPIIDD